jgi:hypothetical protein
MLDDALRQCRSEIRMWLETPLLEVTAWAGLLHAGANVTHALIDNGVLAEAAKRVTFDGLSLAAILLVCLLALRIRGRWRPLHTVALGAIMGDQFSAVITPFLRSGNIYSLELIAAVVVITTLFLVHAGLQRGWTRPSRRRYHPASAWSSKSAVSQM